jgi:ubiquinone/menaquinone biosynthesis C-methylase UbiE
MPTAVVWVVLGVAAVVVSARSFSSAIYDAVITRMTAKWYREVLHEAAPGQRILDVGIGTATALARNAALVEAKDINIVGLDYEAE